MNKEEKFYEEEFFKLLDELKILFFPDKWETEFLEYSKNEILTIIFLYRRECVTISEIADYLMSPLNTVSGVVNRLEKKGMVQRIRDSKDKRIVNIILTKEGLDLYNKEKKEMIFYFKEVYTTLTDVEREALFSIFGKVVDILKTGKKPEKKKEPKVKKIKRINIE